MSHWRLAFILAAPLLLMSCLLTPGRFVSSLDIKRDRSFSFAYAGEVMMLDPAESMSSSSEGGDDQEQSAEAEPPAAKPSAPETAEKIAERRAQAETLAKEAGYRSVEYLGNNKFRVDYAMSGKLDRGFVYPINTDLHALIPWIAVEIRRDGTARVKAIAFGDNDSAALTGDSASTQAKESREGTFTLTTDAELVMHNNEEGLAPGPGNKVVWQVTPSSKTVPTAVVRFAN